MSKHPLISIVVPAYNEAKNYRNGVWQQSLEFLHSQKFSYEVIFVNDGSTDDTEKLLSTLVKQEKKSGHNFNLLNISHSGKAVAVKTGVLAATGEFILFCDFDQATPLDTLLQFLAQHQKEKAEVVIGDRTNNLGGKSDTAFQKLRSQIFILIARLVLNVKANDTQCGFKSLSSSAAKKIFTSFRVSAQKGTIVGGYMGAFDVELLFLAEKYHFKLAQVPVSREDPYGSMGKYNNKWREPLMMLRDIFKIKLFDVANQYN